MREETLGSIPVIQLTQEGFTADLQQDSFASLFDPCRDGPSLEWLN